jgi:hypothetical protein
MIIFGMSICILHSSDNYCHCSLLISIHSHHKHKSQIIISSYIHNWFVYITKKNWHKKHHPSCWQVSLKRSKYVPKAQFLKEWVGYSRVRDRFGRGNSCVNEGPTDPWACCAHHHIYYYFMHVYWCVPRSWLTTYDDDAHAKKHHISNHYCHYLY